MQKNIWKGACFFVPLHEITKIMRLRHILFIIILLQHILCFGGKPFTVVIDAGHGGKDAGAVGHVLKVQEKDLNLDISLRLASKIRTAYPAVNVVLTRSSDIFLPLQKRADIVNKNNADLFICIHTNSAENRSARGAETFILGTERMEANLDVAMRENAVMKLESDYQTTYEGFDPNSIDSYIMFELMQNTYLDQSLRFASMVQSRFTQELKRDDRGVRQAAFWVLLKSACPSVLVEMGFVSNRDEERYMASDKGKREITEAIFGAFRQYYGGISDNGDSAADSTGDDVKEQKKAEDTDQEEKKEEQAKAGNSQPKAEEAAPAAEAEPAAEAAEKPAFRVQIFSARTILPEGDKEFKGLKNCVYEKRGDWYRYMYGGFATKEEAQKECTKLQDKFPGCFVVEVKK